MSDAVDIRDFQIELQDVINTYGYDVKVRDYSGRGMYGKRCLAISGEDNTVHSCISHAFVSVLDTIEERRERIYFSQSIWKFEVDNMGLDMIYYWPEIKFYKEEEKV